LVVGESDNTTPESYSVTKEMFNDALIKLILKNSLPHTFVNSHEFRHLLNLVRRAASPNIVQVYSANTLASRIRSKATDYKARIISVLKRQTKVNLTMDVWTSSSGTNGSSDYLGVVCHFIDKDFRPKQVLLGFEVLMNTHTGKLSF